MKIKELYSDNEIITTNSYLEKCGIKDIKEFYNPSGKYLDDYNLYEDIPYAVQEIKYWTSFDDTTIFIIQDGDLDGICSTLILYQYLVNLNSNWNIQIIIHSGKQRGLDDEDVMDRIRNERPNLVFIPDAGTNNKEQAEELCEMGIGLIVLDHHSYQTPIQKGILINNQNPNYNVQRDGSGTLVTHKFLQALDNEFNLNWSNWFIDLVALSLVSDSMNMASMENRTYYHFGLETIDCINNEFLRQCILRFIGDKPYTQRDISFKIVPKFNSIVRTKDQELKQKIIMAFLSYEDIDETLKLCEQAHKNQINTVNDIIESNIDKINESKNNNIIILSCQDMPRSYSGLVAGKVMNLCNGKPTIIGKVKDGEFLGSLRSPIPLRGDLDENNLVNWASGHEESCGISIPNDNIQPLIDYYNTLNLSYEPYIEVLKSYTIKSIPNRLFGLFGENTNILWGHNIQKPLYHIKLDYSPQDIKILGKNQTTLKITQEGIDIIFFFMSAEKKEQLGLMCDENNEWISKDNNKKSLEVIGTLDINRYTSKYGKVYETNQIVVEDFEVKEYKRKTMEDLF